MRKITKLLCLCFSVIIFVLSVPINCVYAETTEEALRTITDAQQAAMSVPDTTICSEGKVIILIAVISLLIVGIAVFVVVHKKKVQELKNEHNRR